jgi:hypothetical protein
MSVDQISGPKKDLSLLLRLAKAGEIYLQHPKEKQNDYDNFGYDYRRDAVGHGGHHNKLGLGCASPD